MLGFINRTKALFGIPSKSSMDLKSEVKEIMFLTNNDVIIMSKNPSKFIAMMSLLTSYETQVKEDTLLMI